MCAKYTLTFFIQETNMVRNMEEIGCHNLQAKNYDNKVKNAINDYIREKYFEILDRVIFLSDFKKGMKVLDIGIGTGLLIEKITEYLEIYGIDISEKMMEKAQEKGLPIILSKGDFCRIPFPDKIFDRVISTFAFHHVYPEKKQFAFIEMTRVLKVGGYLIIGDFMYKNRTQERALKRKFHRENREDMIKELNEEFFTNIEETCKILHKLGYKTYFERASTLSWILKAEMSVINNPDKEIHFPNFDPLI